MGKPVDCQIFQDQLDSLADGSLPPEGLEGLHIHVRSCPDCEALLRMHNHLAGATQADLEAAVPDVYVEEMWPRVRGAIGKLESAEARAEGRRSTWGWLAPALAAACLVLLAGSVFLYSELRKIKDQERVLSGQLAMQVSMLAELRAEATEAAGADPTGQQEMGLAASRRLHRVFSGRDRVTVNELRQMLDRLPPETQILTAAGAKKAFRRMSPLGGEVWLASAEEVQTDDGLQAGEALRLIDTLGLDPDAGISTKRLVSFSRGLLRAGTFKVEQG